MTWVWYKAVDHFELEEEVLRWAKEINSKSPTAMRMLKYGFNLPVKWSSKIGH
nr:hypothetical protein [Photobacterium iliopiscarium]